MKKSTPVVSERIPPANLWAAVDAIRVQEKMVYDDVPACAFSIRDYATQYKVPYDTAVDQLTRLVDAGKLKTGKRPDSSRGRTALARFYWPV